MTTQEQNSDRPIASPLERLRLGLFRFLTQPSNSADRVVREELLRTLVVPSKTMIFGIISLGLLISTLAIFVSLVQAVMLALLSALIAGWRFSALNGAGQKPGNIGPMMAVVESGILYAGAAGTVGVTVALSGQVELIVVAALVMTGLVFGFCIANSGAPRYAQTQALLIIFPFLLAAGISGGAEMLSLFVQAPIWVGGIIMIINTSHTRLTGLLQAQRTNRQLAYSDMLTGLANRTQIMASLSRLEASTQGEGAPYLLYLDLDGFKGVNDQYGHPTGDALLKAVAQRLLAAVRNNDIVGRIGGDEFIILLGNMPPDQINAVATRLTQAIAKPFDLPGAPNVRIGVSVGGAPLLGSPEQTLAAADAMLYEAKHNGRGTYRLSGI